jgi:hypothetical protein
VRPRADRRDGLFLSRRQRPSKREDRLFVSQMPRETARRIQQGSQLGLTNAPRRRHSARAEERGAA